MREFEHYEYEYEFDDDRVKDGRSREADYEEDQLHEAVGYAGASEYGNEMARSAVERFLESETSTDADVHDYGGIELPPNIDEHPLYEDTDHPAPAPHYNDEEYMTRLADARKERQRRMEKNPVPRPAVRVNVERPRRSQPVVAAPTETEEDWAPMAEEDFNSFRQRYNEPHVMAPRDTKKDRPRGTAVKRGGSVEGPSPLRYMLAFVAIGILGIMFFLALSNRNLRLDRDMYRAQATQTDDFAAEFIMVQLERDSYREQVANLEADLEEARQQGPISNDNDPDTQGDTPSRPIDETSGGDPAPPQPPNPPAPIIHIVESGQVLSRIANQHFGSSAQFYIDLIAQANNLANPNDIYIGQRLTIPVLE